MPDYTGDNGDNTINGSNGNDTIAGLGGDDTLAGGNGNDTISGGAGDDDIEGGNGNDDIDGGSGNDDIDGGNGDDDLAGGSGEDEIDGGNGNDEIDGGGDNDIIYGGNGGDTLAGGGGGDELYGQNGDDHLIGGAGDDLLDGNNGFDIAYFTGPIGKYAFSAAAGYLHVIHLGGTGADGHDRLIRVERLVFADRVIDLTGGSNNAPVAVDDHIFINEDTGTYGSGAASVTDNDFDFEGQALTVTGGTFTGTYGTLALNADGTYSYTLFASAQELAQGQTVQDSFDYSVSDGSGSDTGVLVFQIAGVNDGPIANPDSGATSENAPIAFDVLANDDDVDNGAVLTVTAASAPAGQGTASVAGNQVEFDPGTDFDDLAVGESEVVVASYAIEDEHGATASSTLTITVAGTNDGPVANPDTHATLENAILSVDVLANDTDADNGAILTLTAASAPAGQGTASVVGNQVEFDPGTDFDDLAVGESEVVVASYAIEDEHGATASSALAITVAGTNDGPVANPDTGTTSENAVVVVDVLANDTDADNGAILTLTAASAPAGQGTASVVGNQVEFNPGTDFDYLAVGESAVVVLDYTIEDEHGVQSSSTVAITVEGEDDGAVITGTDEGETLTGTPGDDTIDALGGDDTVFGLPGADLIEGGDGNDQLLGETGNDIVEGGNDDDALVGGDGNDQLLGQSGSDNVVGDGGDDQLSGGEGNDLLLGEAGEDVIEGGNDDDVLMGGDGNDQLLGQSGNDSFAGDAGDDTLEGGVGNDGIDGGEGDDTLEGGDGDDALIDFSGINSLAGGIGDDQLTAGSSGGAQTIDGGDGNDTIRHYGRQFASTIATGAGSDTLELLQADLGAAAIVVSDFTPGAGGDAVRLSGDEGALLSLLSGWDGSSNPFGSGFLRLQQSGADTLLEWDRDGATGGSAWETLVVFQGASAAAFTDANFVPGFHPDGSALAGAVITGTDESEALTGTISNDTIDALAGDDTVSGLAGADLIDGGEGNDLLLGEAGEDVIEGGNDDDVLMGGDGNDQLLGQSGNDSFAGDAGDDTLEGGVGNDGIDGGEGDDTLEGGDGDDALIDFSGINSLAGGIGDDQLTAGSSGGAQTIDGGDGNDTIRHYGRQFASTIATGAGSDTLELLQADLGAAAIVVSDFTPGAGGDAVRLSGDEGALLSLLSGWDGSSNPFGSGFLRLQQSGADTLLEWDRDGATGGSAWETLVVFQGASAAAFTDANFVPGFHPDGSALAGAVITGTDESEALTGTISNDTIDALAGDDTVSGLAGADLIDGGEGNDLLLGEAGEDVIEGGNDDDVLMGGDGNDQLLGQSGNDSFAGDAGDDTLEGGVGNDGIDGGEGDDTLEGGDGDDALIDFSGINSLAGGIGDDQLTAGSSGGAQTIDGGDGNDTIRHYGRQFASTIATGAGSDTLELLQADLGAAAIVVSDFTPGAGGDAVRLSGDEGALLSLLSGWDGSSNPFGSGFLRLQQSGADTLLEWDRDGATGGSAWETLVVFQGASAAAFTDANFVPGFHPDGSALAGAVITGTDESEALTGTISNDTIDALAGDDTVSGLAGADLIDGGEGNDLLLGEAGEDVIEGGNDDDVLMGGDGNDQLLGQSGNDSFAGDAGDDTLEGGVGNDGIDGGEGDDTLEGGDGDDFLFGNFGSDELTGGSGADYFHFRSASDGADEIDDFVSGTDLISISASGFGGGLSEGGEVTLIAGSSPAASGATGQFLFDTDDGRLLWDADGTGSGAEVLIAMLGGVTTLVASDFVVI